MRPAAPLLISIAALWLANVPAAGAQELGRLFLTPDQRATLETRRKARLPDRPQAAAVVESPTARVDGFARRTGGPSTLWINGQALPEGSQQEGLRVLPRPADPSRVTVEIGENERKFDLKIGQTIDRGTGEVKDALRGGEAARASPAAAGKR
ncbi:MAG: hypothetical protein HY017_17180 [Betaproteobacteria bacterium]|nr:hypothetical protein [Betaproteobacteria bacterium]